MSGIINDVAITNSRYHLEFKTGTKMIFNQTSAPTGWTKETGSNDVALRLVSGTVGTGGSVAFETAFASWTPTITMSNDPHTLTIAQLPSHAHTFYGWASGTMGSNVNVMTANIFGNGTGSWTGANSGGGQAVGSGSSHTHDNSATSSAKNLDVSYVDVIIATKD